MKRAILLLSVPFVVAGAIAIQRSLGAGVQLDTLTMPPGFTIAVYSDAVPGARSLTLATDGTVFVGSHVGTVQAVVDRDHDGRGDDVITVADNLNTPNGVAFRDGSLYVAEVNRVLRFDTILDFVNAPAANRSTKPIYTVVTNKLPSETAHGWKYLAFGPDGLLYLQVGAPCNICAPAPPFASILRMQPDGSGLETVARGVRNSVGMDWDPATKDLWFTDNGRDYLGDDQPPDELNHVTTIGEHFGYPYCHAGTIADPEFGRARACAQFTAPAQRLGPHVAAIGMKFYTGTMFPPQYRNQVFIAEHGSWNRSAPIGYRISVVHLENGKAVKYETFAQGWLRGLSAWGRPVDVLVMPDGALLVSDDNAGALYRITYRD